MQRRKESELVVNQCTKASGDACRINRCDITTAGDWVPRWDLDPTCSYVTVSFEGTSTPPQWHHGLRITKVAVAPAHGRVPGNIVQRLEIEASVCDQQLPRLAHLQSPTVLMLGWTSFDAC